MPKLSIGESRPKKWKPIAWLITLVEGTDYSHTFVTYKDYSYNIRYVAEARGSGCRVLSNKMFKKDNLVVNLFQYEVDEEKLYEIHKFIYETLARPYGKMHILGLLYMRLKTPFYRLLKIGRRPSNIFKDDKYSQICTELSARVIEMATGVDIPGNVEDYGLKEVHDLNLKYGERVNEEKIKKINGIT